MKELARHLSPAYQSAVSASVSWMPNRVRTGSTKAKTAARKGSLGPGLRMFIGAGSAVSEVAGSHAIYVSQPQAVAALIEMAVNEIAALAN